VRLVRATILRSPGQIGTPMLVLPHNQPRQCRPNDRLKMPDGFRHAADSDLPLRFKVHKRSSKRGSGAIDVIDSFAVSQFFVILLVNMPLYGGKLGTRFSPSSCSLPAALSMKHSCGSAVVRRDQFILCLSCLFGVGFSIQLAAPGRVCYQFLPLALRVIGLALHRAGAGLRWVGIILVSMRLTALVLPFRARGKNHSCACIALLFSCPSR